MTSSTTSRGPASRVEAGRLLEREPQIDFIERALDEAVAGRGSAIAVEARQGLGKSELLAFARLLGNERGVDVLSAGGRELERNFAFGVVLQLFEQRLAAAVDEERGRLLSGPAREARSIFADGPRAADHSFAVLHGLYWLVVRLTDRAPLMLVLDDADLADTETLRFLLYLIDRNEGLPLTVLMAHGAAVRPTDPRLLRELEHHPAVAGLSVGPLSREGSARLLRRALPGVSDEVCRGAHETSGGNPYLLRALEAELLAASDHRRQVGVGWFAEAAPRAVADHALDRAAALGADAPRLLFAAAVLGDRAELRHAAELAGLEQSEAARVSDALVAAGLVRNDERLSLSQPIVRQAVAGRLPPAERAELHVRAARLLAVEEAPVEQVAGHLVRGARTGSDWVVEVLSGAARRALERGAPQAAVCFMRRALVEPPRPDQRAQVILELGRAEATAGEPQAVNHLNEAIERIADSGQRARTALEAGRTLFALGQHGEAAGSFARGIEELNGRDDELHAQLSAALATVSRLEPARLGGLRPEGSTTRPEGNETPADRALLAQLSIEAAFRGDPRDVVTSLAADALARGALLEEETADGIAYYLACLAFTVAENLGAAEIALTAAVEEARARGSVLGLANACFFRSLAIAARGRVRDAAADARQALATERQGWRLALPGAHAVMADALAELDDLGGARRHLEEAEEAAGDSLPSRVALLASRGHLALRRRQPKRALDDLLTCGELVERVGMPNPAVVPWRSGAARAYAAMGERDEARLLVEDELSRAERFGAPGPVGRALRALGAVEEGERAVEALESAVERLEESQAALERAHAYIDLGAALRRVGRRRAAREPLRKGLDLAQRFGADALATRAMQETLASGARPRRTALEGLEALTPRERQVAELATRGSSNREIADELFVTVKTVEWHLKHTYKKLGVATRNQLRGLLGETGD